MNKYIPNIIFGFLTYLIGCMTYLSGDLLPISLCFISLVGLYCLHLYIESLKAPRLQDRIKELESLVHSTKLNLESDYNKEIKRLKDEVASLSLTLTKAPMTQHVEKSKPTIRF